MLILTDYNKPYILTAIDSPIVPKYYWVFNANHLDYLISPLIYLEETTGPAIELEIDGFSFIVPSQWNILVCDKETMYIDTIPIANCSSHTYQALVSASNDLKFRTAEIKINDIFSKKTCVHPMINKGTMMCHPIGTEKNKDDNMLSIMLGPYDLYSRYLNKMTVNDILY